MDTILYPYEVDDAAMLIRDAMRQHEDKRRTDPQFAEYHAQMARRAKHLLEILKPKNTTHH